MMLADKILEQSIIETRYFAARLGERIKNFSAIDPNKINLDWPVVKNQSKSFTFIIDDSFWNLATK